MSHGGAYEDEMSSLRHIDEEKIDRVLTGDSPPGEPSLDELVAVVSDVEAAYSRPPTEPVRARHLAAMRAARPAVGRWKPAGVSSNGASPAGSGGSGQPKLFDRILRGPLAGTRPHVAVSAAALVIALTVAGLTGLGAMPDRVQAALADAARVVGVEVPDPKEQKKRRPATESAPKPTGGTPTPRPPAAPAAPAAAPRGAAAGDVASTDFEATGCGNASAPREDCAPERAEQPKLETPEPTEQPPVPPAGEQPALTVPLPPTTGDGAGTGDPAPQDGQQRSGEETP